MITSSRTIRYHKGNVSYRINCQDTIPMYYDNDGSIRCKGSSSVVISAYKTSNGAPSEITAADNIWVRVENNMYLGVDYTQITQTNPSVTVNASFPRADGEVHVYLYKKDELNNYTLIDEKRVLAVVDGASSIRKELEVSVPTIQCNSNGNVLSGRNIVIRAKKVVGSQEEYYDYTLLTIKSVDSNGTETTVLDEYDVDLPYTFQLPEAISTSIIKYVIEDNLLGAGSTEIPITYNGAQGAQGQFVYCAGVWGDQSSYTATDRRAPYVLIQDSSGNWQRYVMTQQETWNVSDGLPSEHLDHWAIFNDIRNIFAEVAIVEFGKLGSAVFCGDYMISQYGTINGVFSTNYEEFDTAHPATSTGTNFVPKYCVNLRTGKLWTYGSEFNESTVKGALISQNDTYMQRVVIDATNSWLFRIYGPDTVDSDGKPATGADLFRYFDISLQQNGTHLYPIMIMEDYFNSRMMMTAAGVSYYDGTTLKNIPWAELYNMLDWYNNGKCEKLVTTDTNYTITNNNDVIVCTSNEARTITLPASAKDGKKLTIRVSGNASVTVQINQQSLDAYGGIDKILPAHYYGTTYYDYFSIGRGNTAELIYNASQKLWIGLRND